MSQRPSPWRVNDAGFFGVMRHAGRSSLAAALAISDEDHTFIRRLRAELMAVDGFDRAAVASTLGRLQATTTRAPAEDRDARGSTASVARSRNLALRTLFDSAQPSDTPTLVLLAGALGAEAGRAIGQLCHDHPWDLVPISIEDLQAFHPRYLDQQFRQSPAGQQELSRLAADWLQATTIYARENRYSLLLEGAFRSAETALGVARRFARAGFSTRLVVVATREDENLLAATSRELRRLQDGLDAHFVPPRASKQSFHDLSTLVAATTTAPSIDRVSVVGRHGEHIFDGERSPSGRLDGVTDALRAVRAESMTTLEAAQWLSELRHMTQFTTSLQTVPHALIEALIELHDMGIKRVVPELRVPTGSEAVRIQMEKLSADLTTLRRIERQAQRIDVAAAIVSPKETGPSLTR